MKWTKSQEQAISTNNKNLLISAGAGCGKTAVLTTRILHLMVENKININKFLVMTFTNAAASSMKEKIRKLLYEELKKENADTRFIYTQISNLDKSNITTIDAFCISVIRNYYQLVDVDPNFRIIDNTNNERLKDEAIDEVFTKRYEDNDELFIECSSIYKLPSSKTGDAGFKELIKQMHLSLSNLINPIKWLEEKTALFNMNKEELLKSDFINIIKNEANNKLTLALNDINECILFGKEYECTNKNMEHFAKFYDKITHAKAILDTSIEKFINLSLEKNYIRLSSPKITLNIEEEELLEQVLETIKVKKKNAVDLTKEALSYFSFSLEEYIDTIHKISPYMNVIKDVIIEYDGYYNKLKNDNNVLTFSDTSHLCLEILNNETARKEIREQFEYVFIDEYQDTSDIQEAIMTKLVKKDNLFTVGDVKQSIYRFRNSEPQIFINRSQQYKKEESDINKIIYMNSNFRTNKNLIKGINAFFESMMSKEVGQVDYNEDEKLIAGRTDDANSKIEIHLLSKEEKKDSESIEENLVEVPSSEREMMYIANLISDLVGKPIYDTESQKMRPTKFSDICILSRSPKSSIKRFKEILSENSIPVSAESEKEYYNTFEITTIKNYLNIINNFKDDYSLLSVMRSPLYSFSADELLEIKVTSKEKYFYNAVLKYANNSEENINKETKEKIDKLLHDIKRYYNISLYKNTSELIEEIYNDTHISEYMKALPFGNIRKNNLNALIAKAKEYESFSNDGLYGFVNFIDYAIINEEGAPNSNNNDSEDSIKIMSIHKSKGLEFPIVILMKINKKFNEQDNNPPINLEKNLGIGATYFNTKENYKISSLFREVIKIETKKNIRHEEMRLLYVALTRAKEKLILTGTLNKELRKTFLEMPLIVSSYFLSTKRSYLDWILNALLHSKGTLLTYAPVLYEDDNFKFVNASISWQNNIKGIKREQKPKDKNTTLDKKVLDIIDKKLNFTYKNEIDTKIPTKAGVSSLKNKENTDLLEVGENVIPVNTKPNFMVKEEELSSAEKGTLTHYILETISLKTLQSANNLEQTIYELLDNYTKEKIITDKEMDLINKKSIINFFSSSLGKDLLNSNKIYRELPFNIAIKAKDISNNWATSKEEILVQGIIDLTFEDKNGDMVLIDYKTNHYNTTQKKKILIDQYSNQLKYYKEAIEKLMHKKVSHSYLYFLNKNEFIEVLNNE